MSAAVRISFDLRNVPVVDRILAEFPKQLDRSLMRAINRGAKHAVTLISRAVADNLHIKKADVAKVIKVEQARPGKLVAFVHVSSAKEEASKGWKRRVGRLPLSRFRARQTRKGVSADVQGRKLYPHAFLATMKSGHQGVFLRVRHLQGGSFTRLKRGESYTATKNETIRIDTGHFLRLKKGQSFSALHGGPAIARKREPLVELYGPSIGHVAANEPTIAAALNVDLTQNMTKTLQSQYKLLLDQANKKLLPESGGASDGE